MNDEPNDAYATCIERVISYICSHLDEELSLDRLSSVARFSKFHFHRQFSAYAGLTVAQFVRLVRLKRAAYQLAFDPERSIIAIAYEAGFRTPESFARAFKNQRGQTPSEFRRAPHWAGWASAPRLPIPIRSTSMNPQIVEFETTRVAALEHRGPPESLMASVTRFIQWRKTHHDSPIASSRTFGVAYGDPDAVDPDAFRFDICGELRGPLQPNDAGIVEKLIPGGRCAVARHTGSTDAIGETVRTLYAAWLPRSGEQLRDFPVFFHYVTRMPAVAEHEQVTDIYLPLR